MLLLALAARVLCCTHGGPLPAAVPATTPTTHPTAAGVLRGGRLTLHLVATMASWHPGADDGASIEVAAFGEEGKAPSVPGPLVRVPAGTRIEATVRNALPDTLVLRWACSKRCAATSTIRVAPGATVPIRAGAPVAGAFTYWGVLVAHGAEDAAGGQLRGALIVDDGTPTTEELVTITTWQRLIDSTNEARGDRVSFTINGKVWPYTERLTYTVGDSVRWRVVNLSGDEHPMHLHGFFFRVIARGDGDTTRALAPKAQPLEVTESLLGRQSATLVWLADRTGNWLFHCHKPFHVAPERDTDILGAPAMPHDAKANHAMTGMGALVMGITIRPRQGLVLAGTASDGARRTRLLVHRHDHFYGAEPAYGFVEQHGAAPARDSVVVPGAPIVLHRDSAAEITVVNESDAPTALHWHGIELESFYDGVAGWSGATGRVAPVVAPGDSFVVRFRPPRAGTFIYHTHVDDMRQLAAGLYGPLVVLAPGEQWNDTTDHVFSIGQGGFDAPAWNVVNGRPAAPPMIWRASIGHRLRFLSMTLDESTEVTLEDSTGKAIEWLPVAKDAAPVPVGDRAPRPARFSIEPGETFDFQVNLAPGTYYLRFEAYSNVLLTIFAR